MVWPRADVRDFADAVLRAVLLPARDAAATEGSSHVVRNGSVLRERSAADDGGGDPMLPTRGDVERHGGHRAGETGQITSGERQSEGGGALLPAQSGAPGERGGGHGGDGGGIAVLGELLQKFERYRDAEACCMRLLDFAGPAKQDAKALLREIHNIQDTRMAAGGSGGS